MTKHSHSNSHSHSHDHGLSAAGATAKGRSRLTAVIAMTTVVFVAELIGGLVSGSLALLADAGHMLSDSVGLVMAGIAMFIGTHKPTSRSTYGFRRAEVIAAAINAIAVAAIAVFILVEAIGRLRNAEAPINTLTMGIIATIGLISNIIAALLLRDSTDHSMNLKGAYLHILADLLGSVAVILAAVVIAFTGWRGADTIASVIIVLIIIPRAYQLLREAGRVLMEQVPDGVDTEAIQRDIEALDHVDHVHDLHVWSVDGQRLMATVHVVSTADTLPGCGLLDEVQHILGSTHHIDHSTVQIEHPDHAQHETGVCEHGES